METSLTNFDIYSSSRSVFLFHEYFWLYRCTGVRPPHWSGGSRWTWRSSQCNQVTNPRAWWFESSNIIGNIKISLSLKGPNILLIISTQWADQTIFRLHTQYRGRRRRMRSKWFPGPHWIRTNRSTVWQSQSFRCFSFTSLADLFHSRYIFSSFGIIFSNHVDKILNLKPRMDIS